ncbi:MAG TPA: tetratricopeptide repeat protein [Rhodanobacteraceae bacterium]|jgi:tetratricopeptide (TPR) repeat protein|nr:tetratricopeptide repeat protein [Rhodanobacteraceae bacterium]
MPKPLSSKIAPALLASLALFIAPLAFGVDALVKPVPVPDLSKLPQAKAEEVRQARIEFEKVKPTLVGDALAQAHAMLGALYARAGFYDVAAVALEDAAALTPNDSRWIYAQGIVARMQNQNAAALTYFEHALALNQDYLPIRMAVVNARVEQGDLESARKLLNDFVAVNPKEPVAYAMLGEIALRQKHYAEAVDATNRSLALDPKGTKLYAQLADAYTGAGNAKAAADARAKVGDGMPALGDPIGLGLVQTTAPTQAPAAQTPAQPDAMTPAQVAALRSLTPAREASFLLATRQYDAARQKLEGALRTRPNDAELLGIYARVEAADGNLPQAKQRAMAAVNANPNDASAQFVLGLVLEMGNDDRGAQSAYEKAVSLDRRSPDAQINLGNLLMRSGRYDDAAASYRALAQVSPGNTEAWTRLMAAQVAAGKCTAAIHEINGALAKDAHNGILMQLFVRLTSTCNASSAEEKRMALDYGGKIYAQSDAAPIGEAYALALAANGKWDDAVKTQQAAMFVLVRNGHRSDVPAYRDFLQQFQTHKLPDRPWPATSEVLRPERPSPAPNPTSAQPAPAR